jgi:release factor glutamine methyltransferase
MTDVAAALRAAAARLAATSDTPRLDAELLMAHALGVSRSAVLLDPKRFAVPDSFAALVERRMAHEPVAYITGTAEFWSLTFAVGPGVLIPRGDSETLIAATLAHFPDRAAPLQILDLGTGPGTLLLAALSEYPNAQGLGVDASDTALSYARANADALGLSARARFVHGDWAAGIDGRFDLILCNPPYIAVDETLMPDVADHEPAGALFAGVDGLDDYRRIIPELPRLLAPGGAAVVEIGWTQAAAVTALAAAAGLTAQLNRDLGGRDRALLLTRPVGHGCNQ